MMASSKGHRQLCACTILKVVHIINHMAGRELLFRLPVSDRDLFHLVEEKVYRVVGTMLSEGFPITEFIGGRKNLDSTYTKLLVEGRSHGGGALRQAALPHRHAHARRHLAGADVPDRAAFPVQLRGAPREHEHDFPLPQLLRATSAPQQDGRPSFQGEIDDELTPGDNRFSAPNYRVIHFVADVPVRVPPHIMELAPPGSEHLGPIVYMLCEFQILDAESEGANEGGRGQPRGLQA